MVPAGHGLLSLVTQYLEKASSVPFLITGPVKPVGIIVALGLKWAEFQAAA